MRRYLLMLGVTAACAAALHTAVAQQQCASSSDQSLFEVRALRSELMVLALGCQDDARYNAVIRRFQADLLANDRAMDAYFKRRYGRSAQFEHDRFVTDLANALSRQGSQLGGDFCPRNGMLFNEVMALREAADLPDYAAGKDLVPASLSICTEPAAPSKARKVEARAGRR